MRQLLFVALALAFAMPVHAARPSVPMQDVDDPVVTGSGKPATLEQIRAAVIAAASSEDWAVKADEDVKDRLVATLHIRKHTAVVDVSWTVDRLRIQYKDSDTLGYKVQGDEKLIHPNYNVWVQRLANVIRKELSKV